MRTSSSCFSSPCACATCLPSVFCSPRLASNSTIAARRAAVRRERHVDDVRGQPALALGRTDTVGVVTEDARVDHRRQAIRGRRRRSSEIRRRGSRQSYLRPCSTDPAACSSRGPRCASRCSGSSTAWVVQDWGPLVRFDDRGDPAQQWAADSGWLHHPLRVVEDALRHHRADRADRRARGRDVGEGPPPGGGLRGRGDADRRGWPGSWPRLLVGAGATRAGSSPRTCTRPSRSRPGTRRGSPPSPASWPCWSRCSCAAATCAGWRTSGLVLLVAARLPRPGPAGPPLPVGRGRRRAARCRHRARSGWRSYSPLPVSHAIKSEPLPAAVPSDRNLAVILNPVKVEDIEAFKASVATMAEEAGWLPPRWHYTTVEDPGTGHGRGGLDRRRRPGAGLRRRRHGPRGVRRAGGHRHPDRHRPGGHRQPARPQPGHPAVHPRGHRRRAHRPGPGHRHGRGQRRRPGGHPLHGDGRDGLRRRDHGGRQRGHQEEGRLDRLRLLGPEVADVPGGPHRDLRRRRRVHQAPGAHRRGRQRRLPAGRDAAAARRLDRRRPRSTS